MSILSGTIPPVHHTSVETDHHRLTAGSGMLVFLFGTAMSLSGAVKLSAGLTKYSFYHVPFVLTALYPFICQ